VFEPNSGTNLPFGESVTISVYVDAPDEQATFTDSIKIWKTENHTDYGIVRTQLITPSDQLSLQWNLFPMTFNSFISPHPFSFSLNKPIA